MAYFRYDGIEAYAEPDGGVQLVVTSNQRITSHLIPPHGYVTLIEAAAILQPPVSRVAVYQWVKQRKLKAHTVEGKMQISLMTLRKFAAKHGYQFTKGPSRRL